MIYDSRRNSNSTHFTSLGNLSGRRFANGAGWPVVKSFISSLLHKADVGGVITRISSDG
jgi:hypothetical protein